MSFEIVDALRTRRPLKISLQAPSGAGKTYSGIRLAQAMIANGIGTRFVIGDSENESANLYAGETQDGVTWQYKTFQIPRDKRDPLGYLAAYNYAVGQGYDIVMFDSMTHCWLGALEKVDKLAEASRNKDKFGNGWRVVSPEMERMIATLTDDRAHLITTCRVKSEYEIGQREDGRKKIEKIGAKAVDREGMEYEYDVVVRIEVSDQVARVEKVRGCTAMNGRSAHQPGPEFWQPLFDWWKAGAETRPLIDRLREKLEAAMTLDALKLAWQEVQDQASRLTEQQVSELTRVKDAMKAKLLAQPGQPAEPAQPAG